MPWKVESATKGIIFIGVCPWRLPIGKSKVVIEFPSIWFCCSFYATLTGGFPIEGDFSLFGDGGCSGCSCYSGFSMLSLSFSDGLGGLGGFSKSSVTVGCFSALPKSKVWWSSNRSLEFNLQSGSSMSPYPSFKFWLSPFADIEELETLGLVFELKVRQTLFI